MYKSNLRILFFLCTCRKPMVKSGRSWCASHPDLPSKRNGDRSWCGEVHNDFYDWRATPLLAEVSSALHRVFQTKSRLSYFSKFFSRSIVKNLIKKPQNSALRAGKRGCGWFLEISHRRSPAFCFKCQVCECLFILEWNCRIL